MNKLLLALGIALLFAPLTHAATIGSFAINSFSQRHTIELQPITITAEVDNEITVEHGINILIDPIKHILWDAGEVLAEGTAVDSGRVVASLDFKFLDGYKVLHIPVLSNWLAGETMIITGLKLRSYSSEMTQRYFMLDITGDKVQENQDQGGYKVTDNVKDDITPPFAVTDFTYSINEAKTSVSLNWENPPYYDFANLTLKRTVTRNGVGLSTEILLDGIVTMAAADREIQPGDHIVYEITTFDVFNTGEPVELVVDVPSDESPALPEPEVEPTPDPDPDPDVPSATPGNEELAKLNKLYNYYQVRHAIKCFAATANPTGSACLWAKIDLIYTQALTGQSVVDASLNDHELYLMALRVKWPEIRYQTKCVEADVPDKTCNALGKSLKRIHHFID